MNILQKLSTAVASAGILSLSMFNDGASAASLNWILNDVTFNDGGTATGSFNYDADTNTYGAFSISTQGGSFLSPFTYNDSNSVTRTNLASTPSVIYVDKPFSRYINLAFQNNLTNAGGTVALKTGDPSLNGLDSAWECANCANLRFVTQGSVTTRSVPVPGAIFGVIVAGGALMARQRKNIKAKQPVA